MTPLEALARDYRVALLGYLQRHEEGALHRGYLLGRASVAAGISVLELARVHHDAFLDVLQQTAPENLPGVATAASEFFLEVLAPCDMAQRGFLDGRGTDADPRPGSGIRAPRPRAAGRARRNPPGMASSGRS